MKMWEKQIHDKALFFLKVFVRKLVAGKFQVIQFGYWRQGRGKYGLSMSRKVPDELEEL